MFHRITFLLLGLLMGKALPAQLLLPPNTPEVSIQWADSNAICEYMFLSTITFSNVNNRDACQIILDQHGDVVWAFPAVVSMFDFKIHPNGLMTFYTNGEYLTMDSTFSFVDAYVCKNGYRTDIHDIILRDGHAFLICIEERQEDLSHLLTINNVPGDTNARVFATVIQELDPGKNVVKEWHARPHFDLSDADSLAFISPNLMELNHTNSIDLTADGTMVMSHRSNSELTAIDWDSGRILWRLGGPNNEFSFPNDIGISGQHDARFLSANKISLFDNGQYHVPRATRGLIYALDTLNRVATRTQQWLSLDHYSTGMGSFQLLPNGDALVNYGHYQPNNAHNVSYFRPDSTKVMDLKIQDDYYTYRALCLDIPFHIPRPQIVCETNNNQITLRLPNAHASYRWSTGATTASITVTDTGRYQVMVPMGIGYVGSEVLHVADLNAPCALVGASEAVRGGRPARLLGTYDILGRPVRQRESGQLYLERYDDGSTRKVWQK